MKRSAVISALSLACAAFAVPASAGETPSADGASVYFVNLGDGDLVHSPFKVIFGLSGMGVAPAGVEMDNTGHHHLIINEAIEGEEMEESIPADEQHRHFGGGQTEMILELAPGSYTLQLVLGDHYHIPHNPPVMSQPITITVE